MLLISSAQPCSSNPVWLLLGGNLADRDPSRHTSERSDSLSGTILFHSHMRTPSLKHFQNHSLSHRPSIHLQATIYKDRRIFDTIFWIASELTSFKAFQVNPCLNSASGQMGTNIATSRGQGGMQQTSLQNIRWFLNRHLSRISAILPWFLYVYAVTPEYKWNSKDYTVFCRDSTSFGTMGPWFPRFPGTPGFTIMAVLNLHSDSTCGYYLWI